MRVLLTMSYALMCHCVVVANETKVVSLDEFNQGILPAIRKAETIVQNLEIEFEISGQQRLLGSESTDWKDTFYSKVKLLSDGQRKGRMKIEVSVEKHGASDVNANSVALVEKSYALSYDWKEGKKLYHRKSSKGQIVEVKECTLLSSRSETIRSEMSAGLYDRPFILNFLECGACSSLSEYLKVFMDPETEPGRSVSRSIDIVEFEKTECVRMQIEVEGVLRTTYWLDPARNYAPLAYETSNWDKNGREVGPFTKVLKFQKISDSVWFPVITRTEYKTGRWETKKTLTVSKVRINIGNLRDVDFNIDIPQGYKIIDKRREKNTAEMQTGK